jgi:hypothetical protein
MKTSNVWITQSEAKPGAKPRPRPKRGLPTSGALTKNAIAVDEHQGSALAVLKRSTGADGFSRWRRAVGAKALTLNAFSAARLKPCPDTPQT